MTSSAAAKPAPPGNITSLLAHHAGRTPAATALIAGDERIDWATLEDRARRAARGLHDLGVRNGDRVALWLPNLPAYIVLYLACCRLGAIAVAVNTRFRSVEVADIVSRSGAVVLACAPGFRRIDFLEILAGIDPAALDRLKAVIAVDTPGAATPTTLPPAIERLRRVSYDDVVGVAPFDRVQGGADSGCNIFTTSGTTRAPKFVLHRQGAILAHSLRVARAFGYATPDMIGMGWLPFCGVYGFNVAVSTLAAGKPLVLFETFEPDEAVRAIATHKPTALFGSDDIVDRLLAAAPKGELAFPSVKFSSYAVFNNALADVIDRADARGLKLIGLYGMSEVQALFSRWRPEQPIDVRRVGGGMPVSPLAHARARDTETGELLPPGRSGEIELLGPSMMVGYFGDQAATDAAFTEDRYLKTGDAGHVNEDGSFVFEARMGDTLRLSGFLVNPLEIESHLQEHHAVLAAQVVAVPRVDGVKLVAFVVPRPGAGFDEADVIAHARKGLANFKTPVRAFPVEEFPTTPSANGTKIQRAKLRQMAIERLG